MGELANAIADFLAALLRAVGFVGRPRKRAAIHEDLGLLRELETFEEFGKGSPAHAWLTNHILLQVADFSGLDLRTVRRKVPWGAVIVGTCIWAPLGWLVYYLVSRGHPWFAILPAVPAAIMFLTTVFMFANKEELPSEEAEDGGDGDAGGAA
jgi:hypothetical protein